MSRVSVRVLPARRDLIKYQLGCLAKMSKDGNGGQAVLIIYTNVFVDMIDDETGDACCSLCCNLQRVVKIR